MKTEIKERNTTHTRVEPSEEVSGTRQASHTPGEWRIGDGGITIFGPKSDQPSPITISHVAQSTRTTRDERRANARLIAAAPDLLEALKNMVGALEDTDSGAFQTRNDALAAIAKAEGQL